MRNNWINVMVILFIIQMKIYGQLNPAITSWLQNTTQTGFYYMAGNSTPLSHGILVNCQLVEYSTNNVYVHTTGIPAYHIGPYLDGNPNQAGNQNAIFRLPLNPTVNTGVKTPTTGGNIGILIDGTAIFDFRDGVAWNTTTNAWCSGPGNPPCPGGPGATQSWMRDAVVFENDGFDCAKGHPAGTNYHHHQNPSAFDLDLVELSDICNLYDSDALYVIDPMQHSPLIGYAYDGFPVYGAYGFANTDGTGGITRIKTGYQLRNITVRTHHANGTDVPDGPPVNATYPLGTFREDYEWVAHPGDNSYLDIHNGRFCVTPEYPNGIYCYFATVDVNHNSAYPYFVGPTFYGNKTGAKVTSVTETTTIYAPPAQSYYYLDADNDDFGGNVSIYTGNPPTGYVANNLDCDDTDSNIYPSSPLIKTATTGSLWSDANHWLCNIPNNTTDSIVINSNTSFDLATSSLNASLTIQNDTLIIKSGGTLTLGSSTYPVIAKVNNGGTLIVEGGATLKIYGTLHEATGLIVNNGNIEVLY